MPRRNPFDDIDRLFDRLNRQFEDAAEMLEEGQGDAFGSGFAVDVEDADDEFVVTVDLPGFEKEDVDVRVQDRSLSIS
ncbi:Hsp20/alpha crystallin family protein, partial [Halarchaeum acidiphilum]